MGSLRGAVAGAVGSVRVTLKYFEIRFAGPLAGLGPQTDPPNVFFLPAPAWVLIRLTFAYDATAEFHGPNACKRKTY
jgi:hypothetical protein